MLSGILIFSFFILGAFFTYMSFTRESYWWMFGFGVSCLLLLATICFRETGNVEEVYVYDNGNIEMCGKNVFGENGNEKYEFSKYTIKKGSSNKYNWGIITLEPEYYDQYRQAMQKQEQICSGRNCCIFFSVIRKKRS